MDTIRATTQERREGQRAACLGQATLTHPAMGALNMTVVNASDGGVLLDAGTHDLPPVGALVSVCLKNISAVVDQKTLDMLVVHKRRGFLGLRFL